ncbi:MAG TPA: MBL fold metallo-hydrolase [Bryobacteraceae bacterium]|nr:MBL fold metallo-hydrolase [Bryobacteraceae bacterium]
MTKRRFWILTTFAAFAALAFFETSTDAQPGTLKQIVPGVWFREGEIETMGHCNNAIIEMKDYLIVIDANFPSGARLAMAAAKKVSQKPVKYVFDTHHHGDHSYGNLVWTQAGATTLAYKGVPEEMKRYEPKRWQAEAKNRKDVADLHQPSVEPPKETFDKSPFVIKDDTREVRFYFFGWAHTRGDGFAYLPKEKVLCSGDAVLNGPYNYTADANIGNWPKVVAAAQKLDVEHVLPGHGGPGGKEVLEGQKQYMIELYKAVDSAVKQGKKLQDIVKMDGTKLVSTSIQLPPSVKNWVGDGLKDQVRDTYEEIMQHKPHGDIPHP